MKFGKSLSGQIVETLPEWRDKFLSYKDLKKRLKLIGAGPGNGAERQPKRARREDGGGDADAPSAAAAAMTPEEADFMRLLEAELDKFNSFFVEKEEEYIIRQKELQGRVARAAGRESKEELMRVRKEIVDFHGEMVLLENYSALNYTGLVKILKKYDKRTGALIRLPFIQKVLQQPFFTTDLLYKLVKQRKVFMATEFNPSAEITGGTWYHDGRLDTDAVSAARHSCQAQVERLGVATVDMIHNGILRDNPKAGYTIHKITGIVETMVLDKVLEEVESTGKGEFTGIRSGTLCYRPAVARPAEGGMIEGIPCGVCPRIDECSPEGIISPSTCVYYKKWVQMHLGADASAAAGRSAARVGASGAADAAGGSAARAGASGAADGSSTRLPVNVR